MGNRTAGDGAAVTAMHVVHVTEGEDTRERPRGRPPSSNPGQAGQGLFDDKCAVEEGYQGDRRGDEAGQ